MAAEEGIRSEIQNVGFPAVLKYLRDRGIEQDMLDDLGIKIFPAAELIRRARGSISTDDRLAVVFPHFNVSGDYIDWWSARLVDTGPRPVLPSFANLVPHKRGKMFCPPQEAPHAYLVPTQDWTKLQEGDRIYIHESCIKAIAGARFGYWSIGLNGVWGWISKKHEVALVQELRDLPWKRLKLKPVIVFDSNALDNWDVQTAIGRLSAKLLEICGVQARHLLLPQNGDEHWGFDDFAVTKSPEEVRAYLDDEGEIVEVSPFELMKLQLNEEVCLVRSMGRIAEQATGTLMTRAVFCDVNYAHFTAFVEETKVNVPKHWLTWDKRTVVECLDYMPGGDKLQDGKLNLWRGMGLEPYKGEVDPWLELLERNVGDAALRKWIIQWFAYPLQNPGAKLTTFLHIFGPPGAGKQALLRPLMRIYGPNAVIISKRELGADFNSVYAQRQFINVDEMHSDNTQGALAITNKIKMIVTSETMVVNAKGQPEYVVRNCAQLVTTSNYLDSIRLDDDDRRCAVVRFGDRGVARSQSMWDDYFAWAEGEGAAALYDYLLNVDLEGFDPKGWAPMTEDKGEVTRATRKVDEQWVQSLWEDPDSTLSRVYAKSLCLFTGKQLAADCFAEDPTGVTPGKTNALGIKLHGAGFKKIELKVDGRKVRFWIVRRRDEAWGPEEARKHLKQHSVKGGE
jgi:Predicted ATPase